MFHMQATSMLPEDVSFSSDLSPPLPVFCCSCDKLISKRKYGQCTIINDSGDNGPLIFTLQNRKIRCKHAKMYFIGHIVT